MGEGERDIFWFCFPRAGVQVRSSSQFLHFVLDPAASPGSVGSSCPGGAAAFWGVWRCLLRAAGDPSVGISSFISSPPPEQRNPCPRLFPTSLAPQCGFPFRSGLVLFGASPGLQHPAPTPPGAQPIPGLPGCLRVSVPHFLQPQGGQKPRTPPRQRPGATSPRGG